MGVQVTFDYTAWVALYPQFVPPAVTQAMIADLVLPIAQIYLRNDGGGPVSLAATQTALLNLIVAHVAQLMFGAAPNSGSGVSPIVGRVNTATEGSVNVGAEWPGANASSAFFLQTTYGAMFWQATAAYRTMQYRPGFNRNFNPWPNQ